MRIRLGRCVRSLVLALLSCGVAMTGRAYVLGGEWLLKSPDVATNVCPMDTPTISTVATQGLWAYVGASYWADNRWRGTLLKYRTRQGVMVGADGLPIYQGGKHGFVSVIRSDEWASDRSSGSFGTKGRLASQAKHSVWLPKDKYVSDDLVELMVDSVESPDFSEQLSEQLQAKKLQGYAPSETVQITHAITNGIGAIVHPASIDSISSTLIHTDTSGMVRLIDIESGRQLMAYLPTQVIGARLGVDAAWRLYRVFDGERERLIAVGGFGSSHVGLMAIDVSEVLVGGRPKVLYHLTAQQLRYLSYIHAPVSLGWVSHQGRRRAVFVFGAGSDGCVEQSCQGALLGSAVYAIDAISGERVLEWSEDTLPNQHITHDFIGEVSLIDRQGDGVFEHVYAADLGGQIFRFDKTREHQERATRVFWANDPTNPTSFYQKPIVSLYRTKDYPLYHTKNRQFAVISIASNGQLPIPQGVGHVYGIFDDGLIDGEDRAVITSEDLTLIDDDYKTPIAWFGEVARTKGWRRVLHINGDTHVIIANQGAVVPSNQALKKQGVEALYHLNLLKPADCPADVISQPKAYCLPFGVCAHHQTGRLFTKRMDNQTVLVSPSTQGFAVGGVMKSVQDDEVIWQVLGVAADDVINQDSMNADGVMPSSVRLSRVLRASGWYDVRTVGAGD